MTKSPKETTYEKIIKASLKLFNEQGERYVTTNHIVAYLNISPGNLYYYFQNKEEIIEEIFRRYNTDLLSFVESEKPKAEREATFEYVSNIFEIMWRYRFIFADSTIFSDKNSRLREMRRDYTTNKVTPIINAHLDALVEDGWLNMTPIELEVFKNNFWMLVRYWFDYDKVIYGELKESSKLRGVMQALGLLKPFLREEDKIVIDELYEKWVKKKPIIKSVG